MEADYKIDVRVEIRSSLHEVITFWRWKEHQYLYNFLFI